MVSELESIDLEEVSVSEVPDLAETGILVVEEDKLPPMEIIEFETNEFLVGSGVPVEKKDLGQVAENFFADTDPLVHENDLVETELHVEENDLEEPELLVYEESEVELKDNSMAHIEQPKHLNNSELAISIGAQFDHLQESANDKDSGNFGGGQESISYGSES